MSDNNPVSEEGFSPYLDEAEALAADMPGLWSDGRKRRYAGHVVPVYRQHWVTRMSDYYAGPADRAVTEYDDILIPAAHELGGTADQILEDLESGRITAAQANREMAALMRDLRRVPREAKRAADAEEQAWKRVNLTPGEFQRAMSERFPQMFLNGRGRPRITARVLDGQDELKFG